MNRDPFGLDFLVRRGNPEEFACVHTTTYDLADNQVALRDLHPDVVTARSCDTKDLCRLFHSLTIQADAGNRRIVRNEILRDVLVEDAPVARLVVVDRLDVAANQVLVLLGCHLRRLLVRRQDRPKSMWRGIVAGLTCPDLTTQLSIQVECDQERRTQPLERLRIELP